MLCVRSAWGGFVTSNRRRIRTLSRLQAHSSLLTQEPGALGYRNFTVPTCSLPHIPPGSCNPFPPAGPGQSLSSFPLLRIQ